MVEEGRVKQVQTTLEPRWVHEALQPYTDESDVLSHSAGTDNTHVGS